MNLKSAGVKLGKPAGAEAMGFSHISLALSIEKCELLRDVVAPLAFERFGLKKPEMLKQSHGTSGGYYKLERSW